MTVAHCRTAGTEGKGVSRHPAAWVPEEPAAAFPPKPHSQRTCLAPHPVTGSFCGQGWGQRPHPAQAGQILSVLRIWNWGTRPAGGQWMPERNRYLESVLTQVKSTQRPRHKGREAWSTGMGRRGSLRPCTPGRHSVSSLAPSGPHEPN